MKAVKNSYFIQNSERPVFTPFEADMSRYLHISDCSVIQKVWQPYWEFCPVCCACEDKDGMINHRPKAWILC